MGAERYNEKELIIQLQNDHIKAFNQLYFKYHSAIYRNIIKLLKDNDESENILQEVFVALWQNRAELDPEKPIANWLFVVSYNKAISYLKKVLNDALILKRIEHELIYTDEKDELLNENRLKIINEACLTLSPQKRKVFDLCKLQGKTYEEAARELNISKYTVKEYLSAAIKSVKEYADQHPGNKVACIYLLIVAKIFLKN